MISAEINEILNYNSDDEEDSEDEPAQSNDLGAHFHIAAAKNCNATVYLNLWLRHNHDPALQVRFSTYVFVLYSNILRRLRTLSAG